MSCNYERFIQTGGFSGTLCGARAAELLRKHQHHSACGGLAIDPDFWIRERFKLHREAAERDAAERRNRQGSR